MTSSTFSTRRRFLELPDEVSDAMLDKAFKRAQLTLKLFALATSLLLAGIYVYMSSSTEIFGAARSIFESVKTAFFLAVIVYVTLGMSLSRCVLTYASGKVFKSFADSLRHD